MAPLLWSVRIPTWLAIIWRKYLARNRRPINRSSNPRNIIVFRLDQLGDVVLTTPIFRELKRLYPRARCTVVVRQEYKAILVTNRNVDEILTFSELKAKWLPARACWLLSAIWFYWTQLRKRQFDLAISPRWDVDESLATLLCALTHASVRVGHSAKVSSEKHRVNRGFDAAFDIMVPPGTLKHEVDRNLAVVEVLGGKVKSSRLEIRVADNDRKFADELFTHHDPRRVLIAIGIGGHAVSRRWPLERYAATIARLNQHRPVQPVILCSADEDVWASQLAAMLKVPPYILSGVPLRAVCAVLEKCDLFIGNDTGTAHLAAAMDCPTLVISRHPANGDPYHANSPVRFGPRCARSRVLQPFSGIDGCVMSCRSREVHCILQVTADTIISAALEFLTKGEFQALGSTMPDQMRTAAVQPVHDFQSHYSMVPS